MADTSALTWPSVLGRLIGGVDLGAADTAWVMDRVLYDHGPAYPYEPGSWGPTEADALVDDPHGWHHPGP